MSQPVKPQGAPRKPSTKASITGGILAVLAFLSSGIATILVHLDTTSKDAVHNDLERAGGAVADGITMALFAILSVPFAVGGIVLGVLAIIFTALRLRKVKVAGLIFSIIFVALSLWAFATAVSVFDMIKADPVEPSANPAAAAKQS